MALDYLPAQTSSVPSERAFSSSAETDTRRRNRITPELMEKLQMLKYMLKRAQLDFTGGWKCDEKDLELENECIDAQVEVLTADNRYGSSDRPEQNGFEQTSSGSGDDDWLSDFDH